MLSYRDILFLKNFNVLVEAAGKLFISTFYDFLYIFKHNQS